MALSRWFIAPNSFIYLSIYLLSACASVYFSKGYYLFKAKFNWINEYNLVGQWLCQLLSQKCHIRVHLNIQWFKTVIDMWSHDGRFARRLVDIIWDQLDMAPNCYLGQCVSPYLLSSLNLWVNWELEDTSERCGYWGIENLSIGMEVAQDKQEEIWCLLNLVLEIVHCLFLTHIYGQSESHDQVRH